MSAPGGAIEPHHLSADLTAPTSSGSGAESRLMSVAARPRNLAAAVADVEKELIVATLDRTRGNVSETARVLGLTRRGLYLKMRRLQLDAAVADTK
jgi:DNA-binding NtrC family response regulator